MPLKIKKQPDEVWIMKDGSEITVGDMTGDHAKNCLRLLLRRQQISSVREDFRLQDLDKLYYDMMWDDLKWGKD